MCKLHNLLSVVFLLCLVSGESRAYNQIAGASFNRTQMRSQGNCLPFELHDVQIESSISVTAAEVRNLIFTDPDNIMAVMSNNKVYTCNIRTHDIKVVSWCFGEYGELFEYNPETFILIDSGEVIGTQVYMLDHAFDDKGNLLWCNLKINGRDSLTVFDGKSYFYAGYAPSAEDKSGFDALISINAKDGFSKVEASLFPMTSGIAQELFAIPDGILCVDYNKGPYLFSKSDNGYSKAQLWNRHWDHGTVSGIIDQAGRYINRGVREEPIVILPKGDAAPVIIDYMAWVSDELGCQYMQKEDRTEGIASNGQTIVFTAGDAIVLCNSKGGSSIWFAGIDGFLYQYSDKFTPMLYVDKNCKHFISGCEKGFLNWR